MEKDLKCKICGIENRNQSILMRHLKKNHPEFDSYEHYIINFYFNNEHPKCKCGCGNKMKFESFNPNFYNDYCTNHFPRKPHTDETKKQIKETYIKTMTDRYGVDNPMKLQVFIDKIGDTKELRHGTRNYNNPEKLSETKFNRTAEEVAATNEKLISTNMERFGAKTFTSTSAGKLQVRKTKLEKYGDENYVNVEKIKQTKLEKYGYDCEFTHQPFRTKHNLNNTKIQNKIADALNSNPHSFMGYNFDIKFQNFLIEVDGSAYHLSTMNDLTLTKMGSAINDFRKTNLCKDSKFELLRIRPEIFQKSKLDITFENIWENAYEQDYSFDNNTKFLTKEYLKKYIEKKGKDNLKKYWRVLLRFIRQFQPEFPLIQSHEIISNISTSIKNYDIDAILADRTFNNNSSLIGVSHLKSMFKSYWKSSFKDSKSPIDAWQDDKIMEKVIKYRIGLNNSGEIFDFSIHQMIRGLSATRHTISFFKPVLAAAIYKHFIGDKENPTVFDPCCGFGGRLLGFKSLYPDGIYIGCEPNIETFNELVELSKNFTNVHLFNCKLEDFNLSLLPDIIDLTFTSIPYYDLETYSNPVEYSNFEHWKETFIQKLKSLPNLLVNIPVDLRDCFDQDCEEYFISSNTSHFNKLQNKKFEYLLDFKNKSQK